MNNALKIILGAMLLGGLAGGYWYGRSTAGQDTPGTGTTDKRKPLYYRNPMGLPDISPVPRKDPMGMDYVPVYAEDVGMDMHLAINPDKVQKLGVRSEAATRRELARTLRMVGRIEIDERRIWTIAPRFEGWIERLYVNTTGQTVRKGQPLFDVYSPALVSTRRELALAEQALAALGNADEAAGAEIQRLVKAGRARLKNWEAGWPDARPDASTLTFLAPGNGVVLEKQAMQGMRFIPGETLYRIADLSAVWVIAEVPEQEISLVRVGDPVQVTVDGLPGQRFRGHINFLHPTLNAITRTVAARIEIPNPKGLLRPGMYASVQLTSRHAGRVLTVPDSAVIDSGLRQVVLVRLAEGHFEPRTVRLGTHGEGYVEVLDGIAEGEQVVTRANFLLDAESNLKAALNTLAIAPSQSTSEHAVHSSGNVGHTATGRLNAIHEDGTVSITHDPIPSLKWPAMTMDFTLADPSLATRLKPGISVRFELAERGEGEWVITKLVAQEAGHAEYHH